MNLVIAERHAELKELCARFGVERLELFGSGTGSRFDSGSSDLDFLVEFQRFSAQSPADRYFGLLESLEELFGRPVDLLEEKAVRNPYFLESIQASRTLLYYA